MAFKVNPAITSLKAVSGLVLSYIIVWGVTLLFIDSTAKSALSPITHFTIIPFELYVYPLLAISAIITISVIKSSYIPDNYGNAREATESEIESMGLLCNSGLILGQTKALFKPKFIRSDQPLSAFLIAPPGTGKTLAIIVPNLLSCTNSMVIHDVKLELWDMTSAQRGRIGNVGLFAPTLNLGKDKSLCFNPFASECLPQSFAAQIDYVDQLVSVIYPTHESLTDTTRYFNANAKNLFMFWALRGILINGETSLPQIYDDATQTADQQAAIASILENSNFPDYLQRKGMVLLDMQEREFKSSVTSFTQLLEPFNRPNIRKYFEASDFTFRDFREKKPFSLYLGIPVRDSDRMAPIIKLMAQYLTLNLMSETKLFKKQTVTFVLDEFARLGKVEELINAPELSRGCYMNFLFCFQSGEQIKKIYNTNGGNAMKNLIDVCEYTIIYTQNDPEAAEYLSKTIGKTTRRKKSDSKKFGELTGSSTVSYEGVPFVTDQDLLNMGGSDMIVTVKEHRKRPIMCTKPWVTSDRHMKKLLGAHKDMVLSDDNDHTTELEHALDSESL